MKRSSARGQGMVEYIVVVFFMLIVMFTPVFDHPDGGGRISIFFLFIEAFDIYINSFHTVITLPIP